MRSASLARRAAREHLPRPDSLHSPLPESVRANRSLWGRLRERAKSHPKPDATRARRSVVQAGFAARGPGAPFGSDRQGGLGGIGMAVPLHDLQDGVLAEIEALGDDPVGELLLLDHADHLRRQAIRLRPLPCLWIAVQDLSQLDAIYGASRAKTLRNN